MTARGRPWGCELGSVRRDNEGRGVGEGRRDRGEHGLRCRVRPLDVGDREDDRLRPRDAEDQISDRAVEELAARVSREWRQGEPVPQGREHQLGGLGLETGESLGDRAVRDLSWCARADREGTAQKIRDRAVCAVRVVRRAARACDASAERPGIR